MTFPGEVVETNGEILSASRVSWHFEAKDAYPLGYPMEGRSLESQPEVQKELLSAQPLDNREAMLQFISLVSQWPDLLGVLQKCREQKSMTALYDFRESLASGKDKVADLKRLIPLWKVLRLSDKPPPQGN